MELTDAIRKRHAFRAYTSEPVTRQLLERMLAAAALAPSAMNKRVWQFHVASGEARTRVGEVMSMTTVHLDEYLGSLGPERLARARAFFADLGSAPIVVAISVPEPDDELGRINAYMSAGAAMQNFMLCATELGIATCNLTFSYWVRDRLAEAFGVGPGRDVVSIVLVGHPAEEPLAPEHDTDVAAFVE